MSPSANEVLDEPVLDLSGSYANEASTFASVLEPRQTTSGLEFRPELSEAVQKRREERAHRRDLSAARIARLGLDVETYNLVDSGNGHLKTEKGCFEWRSDVVGNLRDGTGGARFWMTRCKESRRTGGWGFEMPSGE